jgi:glutaredoxin 3
MRGRGKRKQPRVIVFTAPSCGFCRTVKHYLRQQRIRFKEVDVSRDAAAARDIVRRTGQQGVPVVYIGSRFVVGFDRRKIDKLLGLG